MTITKLAIFAALAACSGKPADAPGSGSSKRTYDALDKKPAEAKRATPPPEIDAKAVAIGAKAPDVGGTDHTGAPWGLATELAKHARVMLVFYRGDW